MNTVTTAPNEPTDILLHIALLVGWAFNYMAQHDPPPGSEARTVADIIASIITCSISKYAMPPANGGTSRRPKADDGRNQQRNAGFGTRTCTNADNTPKRTAAEGGVHAHRRRTHPARRRNPASDD